MAENQNQDELPKGIPVELVVKRLDERKTYQIRLEFIPKEGDSIHIGDVPHKVVNVKYRDDNGSYLPVIMLEPK